MNLLGLENEDLPFQIQIGTVTNETNFQICNSNQKN